MKQIQDNPNGWIPFVKEVRRLLGRELNADEVSKALQAYIKPITAQAFVDKLKEKAE